MRMHNFKNDPKKLLETGLSLVTSSSDAKFIHRVVMVNLMLSGGFSARQLSKLCGIPHRTLSQWLYKVDENGFEALRAIKQEGRPSKLNDEQLAIICDSIKKDPKEFGYEIWDGPSLSDFIKKKFDIDLGIRQCQRLFHKLGFSLVRPQTFPSVGEANTQEREIFKKK